MRFNPDLPSLVPIEQLDAQFGGDNEYEFEADSYWDQVLESAVHTFIVTSNPLTLTDSQSLRNSTGWH